MNYPLALALVIAAAPAACSQPGAHRGALEPTDSRLNGGEHVDSYTLDVRAGQTVQADLGSEAFDPYLLLVAPSGTTEAFNDDHEGSQARSQIRATAAESGRYRVLVTSYAGGETGAYTLALRVASSTMPDARTEPGTGPARPAPRSPGGAQPAAASTAGGRPVGLFFMTRYWMATSSLEKVVWYFAPDGRVYQNLATGFSEQDLAAHEGPRGTYRVAGRTMTMQWSDGSTSESELEDVTASGFMWDAGIFTAVTPFDGRSIAGTYEGGEFTSSSLGSATSSNTLDLRPDGTFDRSGGASFSGETADSEYSVGGYGPGASGRWSVEGYALTLAGSDGETTRGIAFPYDDRSTPAYPDRLFFNGTMYTRQ